jgi:ADP-heptose:LPS heptosyltransferase
VNNLAQDLGDISNNELQLWLRRRNTPDTATTKIPRRVGRLKRKLQNIERRISIFFFTLYSRKYRHSKKPDIQHTQKVLLIPHFPIGDLVLTSPLWMAIKKRNPAVKVGVVVSNANRDVLRNENIDNVYNLYSGSLFKKIQEIRRARHDGWDVVIATAGFYKPTRFAFISRIIAKNGITSTMNSARQKRYARIYSFCFKKPSPWESIPMTDQYIELLEKTFDIHVEPEERFPHFTISPEIRTGIHNRINKLLSERNASTYIVINLEAKSPSREWGFNNIHDFIQRVAVERSNIVNVLIASPNFRKYFRDELAGLSSNNCVIFETETIHHVAALIENSALVISPDTAIVHIAAALGKKTIAFYPSADEWLPYSSSATVLFPERWEPISSIAVDTVYSKTISLLNS